MRVHSWKLVVSVLIACGEGGVTLVDPPTPPPAALRIQVLADSEDAGAAAALGWAGGIPSAEVVLTPFDSSAPAVRQSTNANGIADFGLLPAGSYAIDASRWLTSGEAQRLSLGDDVVGWVWRDFLTITRGSAPMIFTPASRRKSLVISEWAFNQKGSYYYGGFLELYNNADTTVFLDGIVIGSALAAAQDFPSFPCAVYAAFRNDDGGAWSRRMAQIPGRGRDYPLQPGRAAVIATDAVDHAAFISGGLDLRQADFELQGQADVDNPAVPNVPSIGLNPGFLGHGIEFGSNDDVAYVALPFTLDELPRRVDPRVEGQDYLRVPRAKLLDVVTITHSFQTGYPLCANMVHRLIDRAPSAVRQSDEVREYLYSVARRGVPQGLGTGRLQHSRRSASDFVRTLRSPGRVP